MRLENIVRSPLATNKYTVRKLLALSQDRAILMQGEKYAKL